MAAENPGAPPKKDGRGGGGRRRGPPNGKGGQGRGRRDGRPEKTAPAETYEAVGELTRGAGFRIEKYTLAEKKSHRPVRIEYRLYREGLDGAQTFTRLADAVTASTAPLPEPEPPAEEELEAPADEEPATTSEGSEPESEQPANETEAAAPSEPQP